MNKLTIEEITEHVKPENKSTGVKAITESMCAEIDLDEVPDIVLGMDDHGRKTVNSLNGKKLFHFDQFTPRAGSYAFKPSFAGSQILMGKIGRKLYFTNGRWFV